MVIKRTSSFKASFVVIIIIVAVTFVIRIVIGNFALVDN